MQKELKFLEKHSNEIFKKYKGENIAIVDDRIVAHGKDFRKVAEEARKVCEQPLFMKVPQEEVGVYFDRISIYRIGK